MNKKFPCEECREQKRKCDCKQPCDRCDRFNLKCVYLQAVSPRDQEYVEIAKREEMRCEIKALTEQSEMLEREMRSLQSAMRVQHQHSPPMSAKDDFESLYKKGRPYLVSPMMIPHSSPINDLTVTTPPDASCSSLSSTDDSISTASSYATDPADNHHKYHDHNYNNTSNKRRRVIAQKGQLSVALIRDKNKHKPWTLTVKDGKMAIETFINSHSDLMARVWDMTSTLRAQDSVPFSFYAFSTVGALLKMFNTMMLNKYGKTYCRSMVNAMRISALLATSSSSSFSAPSTITPSTTSVAGGTSITTDPSYIPSSPSLQTIESLTMPLLEAYFRCRHFHHLALHVPAFMRLFVTNYSDICTSPVAMALCATICVSDNACCHHITKLVPPALLNAHAEMYYGKAKQLISDRFDDLCLETFATYVFLTSYILHSSSSSTTTTTITDNDNIGQRHHYRDFAERFMHLLEPYRTDWPLDELILFQRLKTYLQRLLTYELAFTFKSNDINMRETGYVPFYEASHSNSQLQWYTADDDTDTLREFIEMQKYLQQLRGAVFKNSRASGISSQDLTVLTETVIQQQIKHATAHWYMHILPDHLKLPLPVLDATSISDSTYFATLEAQSQAKGIVPVLTTLALYDEIILIIQSFLHKRIPNPATNWYFLDQYWQGGKIMVNKHEHPAGEKWVRRITKLLSVKEAIAYPGTDDEFFSMVKEVMFPSQPVQTSVVQIGIQVAINMVRLLRFIQTSQTWSCFFDMRILTDVWIVMFRILRFEDYLDAKDRRWIPTLRKDMNYCLAMARKQLGNEDDIGMYVQDLDKDFRDLYVSFSS